MNGVLYHCHLGCRSVAGDAVLMRDAILKKLSIVVLTIEWDNFVPRAYKHWQYEDKLETF